MLFLFLLVPFIHYLQAFITPCDVVSLSDSSLAFIVAYCKVKHSSAPKPAFLFIVFIHFPQSVKNSSAHAANLVYLVMFRCGNTSHLYPRCREAHKRRRLTFIFV